MEGILSSHKTTPAKGILGVLPEQYFQKQGLANGLKGDLLGSSQVATPEQSSSYFDQNDFRWMETLKGSDSPTGRPLIHINDRKYEQAQGRKITDSQRQKIIFAESLHNLKDVDPSRHQALLDAAINNNEFMDWANKSYDYSKKDGEKRPFEEWLRTSRFDQVIGGYLFAGDKDFPTMKDWDRSEPYGDELRTGLEQLRIDLDMQ